MATRRKRQTNVLHDNTTGTVNITPSSNPAPQNTGFFDRGFTNTGSSSRRRRRRRLHARARQQAHQAWADAVNNEHEARLLAESAAFLEQRSTELSEHHARMSQARQNNALSPRASTERLWSAIAASNTSGSLPAPAEGLEKAGQIAKEIFIREIPPTNSA